MFQEILLLLPRSPAWPAAAALTVGVLIGLCCWIAGARFNQKIMTLLGVAAGGVLGIAVPRYLGSDVNTMATSLSGALVIGVLAFVMPRIGVAIGMAALLAAWGSLCTWIFYHGTAKLEIPTGSASFTEFCHALWTDFPDRVRTLLPVAAAVGAGIGLVLTIFLPRIATALFYSALGVSLLLLAGLWGVRCSGTDLPRFLPAGTHMQTVLLAGLVALGVVLQIVVMPIKKKGAPPEDAGKNKAQPSHAG